MIKQELCTVVNQVELAPSIFEITLTGNIVKKMNQPGQFVHLKITAENDPLLRRPISICSLEKERNEFKLIYRVKGEGTAILANKQPGDVVDVLGPLGNGFPVSEVKKGETALLIGGGVGTPPLYELSKQLVENGARVVHLFGYETKQAIFYEEKFKQLGETYITTVDGSYGIKGVVTDVLEQLSNSYSAIYSCGPQVMLQSLQKHFAGENLFISLEQRMGCGIGACFACVCETQNNPSVSYKKICSDGPVFRAEEVVIK